MGKSHLSWWFGCKEDGLHRGERAGGDEGKKGEKKTGCEGRWEGRLQAWGIHTIPQRLLFVFYYLTLDGYYSALIKNPVPAPATPCMSLEDLIQSEVCQAQNTDSV